MLRQGGFGQPGLRWRALGLVVLLAATSGSADAARHRPHRHGAADEDSYQPSTASIVVDANSGADLEAANADSPRHPASLTKIMTLYLLFEQLEAGKLKLSSELPVSIHAAEQAPSKLGLAPGETIKVESAIRAIVTKSANDVAVVVGEAIGGNEVSFGKMMTAKARALGMAHTNYHNASGLPDDSQITTARDQSILARAIQDRFPQYYHYFATPSFEFRGEVMRNHNHLLGLIPGVDGMKTGYIRASGFNIVTSVHRGNRRIIAVVFGGRTASARDARVTSLIEDNINIASIKHTAPPVGEGRVVAQSRQKPKAATEQTALVTPVPVPVPNPRVHIAANEPADKPFEGSTAPLQPTPVKTFVVHPATMQTTLLEPAETANNAVALTSAATPAMSPITVEPQTPLAPLTPAQNSTGTLSEKSTPAADPVSITSSLPEQTTKTEVPVKLEADVKSEKTVEPEKTVKPEPTTKPEVIAKLDASARPERIIKPHSGWLIQIGAFDDEKEAKQHLAAAQSRVKDLLGKANPFTERASKGEKAIYRARFAGLGKEEAQSACKHLKRSEIPCMMLKN